MNYEDVSWKTVQAEVKNDVITLPLHVRYEGGGAWSGKWYEVFDVASGRVKFRVLDDPLPFENATGELFPEPRTYFRRPMNFLPTRRADIDPERMT